LDLISGLLRLLLDDYENADGRDRLESSLKQITGFEQDIIDIILKNILKVGVELSNKNKSLLAESLYKFFNTQDYLMLISKALGDSYSMTALVELATKRLEIINKKIYGGFRKIG